MSNRYGTRRGSVSGSFRAYRVEYWRTNVISGEANEHAMVVYARTDREAERKATKKLAGLPGLSITRIWCTEK